jgi:hypothetical protein
MFIIYGGGTGRKAIVTWEAGAADLVAETWQQPRSGQEDGAGGSARSRVTAALPAAEAATAEAATAEAATAEAATAAAAMARAATAETAKPRRPRPMRPPGDAANGRGGHCRGGPGRGGHGRGCDGNVLFLFLFLRFRQFVDRDQTEKTV